MKKIVFGLLLMALFTISACGVIEEGNQTDLPKPQSGLIKSSLARETAPQVTDDQIRSLTNDNTAFALPFYDQIRHEQDNIIISPFSLSVALSMTLAGAEGSTEAAMLDSLNFSLSEDEIYPALNALLQAIEKSQGEVPEESEGSSFKLNIANSIWGQAGFDFEQSFLDTLARHFGAGLYTIDFIQDPQVARNAINDWVEDKTQDKIQDLIPPDAIDSLTRLVLANAIYFNGSWLHPFDEANTEEGQFTTENGSMVSVDMMKLFAESLSYTKGLDYQAVSLPYMSRDFSMVIIVPDQDTFKNFQDSLSAESLARILAEMAPRALNLQMPKLNFESNINANQPLKSMGMAEAFNPDLSDFTGIADIADLHITDVLHKATITVDEQGTEAAAATAVIIGRESAPIDEPISLVIDRPYLFFILHIPTDTILFMGRVINPNLN